MTSTILVATDGSEAAATAERRVAADIHVCVEKLKETDQAESQLRNLLNEAALSPRLARVSVSISATKKNGSLGRVQ